MTFLLETIRLGLANLRLHLLRSILTALGIILGVAAVIAMVSIGEGTKQQALLQLESLGARNIIARSQKPPETTNQRGGQQRSWINRYGLTRDDLRVVAANFPDATAIVPVKEVGSQVLRGPLRKTSQAFGTTPDLRDVANLRVARGRYITEADMRDAGLVAVIGDEIARQFFQLEDPLGSTIKIDNKVFTVIGVLSPVGLSGGAGAALVGRDLNLDIHIPLSTADQVFGDNVFRFQSGSFQASSVQISEIYVQSPERDRVILDAERLRRIVDQRRRAQNDVSLIVPYELLEQARKTALTWGLVLSAIASISLLVGGIGIMNIMLATVTERTREIGIRRAVGATRRHILWQFLVETSVLSTIGGLAGVVLGVGGSWFVDWVVPMLPRIAFVGKYFPSDAALPTSVTWWSIFLAFGVATLVGLVFGIYPARKAAEQDPIVALRHD